ncbi:MAG: trypsin-like peptidase domain-containing protein [Planctomycetes bacterium]|nr:trypsin-like peptidase domain-containing protein [Planctomycetota bacterium]
MRAICGLLLLAVCAGVGSVARSDEPNQRQLLAAVEKQLKDTAATAGPSIATIVVSRSEHYPKIAANADTPGKLGDFDPKEFLKSDPKTDRTALAKTLDISDLKGIPDHGYAGGVVIDAEGYVLTPYHVIDGATKVYVFLPGGVGSYADIHAADARSDLAVLKLISPPPRMQAIKFGDVRTGPNGDKSRTVFTGKLCVLLTNAYSSTFGLEQPTAGFGSITNVRSKQFEKEFVRRKEQPPMPTRGAEFNTLLEYDIKPNAGMTGGVLLNLDGEMIGLTNAAAVAWGNEIGPGCAVPVDANFRRIVGVLRKGEEVDYGFLGVTLSEFARPQVVVGALSPKGPAANAGIALGEQITHVNGNPIESYPDLLQHIGSALAGSRVKITLSRGFNRQRDVEVTLTKFGHEMPFIASVRPEPVFGLRVDHRDVLNAGLRVSTEAWKDIRDWVSIREIVPNSPAATKFKALGENPKRWMITHVNGTEVTTPAEFYKAAKGQEKIKLTLLDSNETNPRPRELMLP